MFDPATGPRIFALPPGVDFARAFLTGLRDRCAGQGPEALARAEIYVNTRRAARRLHELLLEGPASLLPRIRVITDLADLPGSGATLPPATAPLRRRLELAQAVTVLLDREPDLAPRAAAYDLADSLAALLSEMHDEGVAPGILESLDVSRHSAHWERSLRFLKILFAHFLSTASPDPEARMRLVVEALAFTWKTRPPTHPVIVAGSTGSRGTTALFMKSVAALPQGALVLPGFDFDLPADVWATLADPSIGPDHPQGGFARLLGGLGADPKSIQRWTSTDPSSMPRNRLISLAMRPAPVTDQWLSEGPALRDIDEATRHLSLIEADDPRAESLAIALMLRKAAEEGRRAALITPDRTLTRRVAAALERWRIVPDDSAGRPLSQTPPGVFLRLVAAGFGADQTGESLLALLKHPLTASAENRGHHLGHVERLERWLRRHGPAFLTGRDLTSWAESVVPADHGLTEWAGWVAAILDRMADAADLPLATHVERHRAVAIRLAAGDREDTDAHDLWQKKDGEAALKLLDLLAAHADAGGIQSPMDYAHLVTALMRREDVRDAVIPHELIAFWGTLEARTQSADLVILGGLNDGTWPGLPPPDPWFSRSMRADAGLRAPERLIGLAAHDFQQAVAGPEVVLSRAVRDAEAPTVPSRWLVRLTNLLDGIGPHGEQALRQMRVRGTGWCALAKALETPPMPVAPAPRPSPRPPVDTRPRALSVTEIRTLIRDPYAIYAKRVLGLKPLDPLRQKPDALLRGSILHAVLEDFVRATPAELPDDAAETLRIMAEQVLARDLAWPAARRLWLFRLMRVADGFLADERTRRARGRPAFLEHTGRITFGDPPFTLTGKADRIDRLLDGRYVIYDYKTGTPPSPAQVKLFDKQLLLEARMIEDGAFDAIPPGDVAAVEYIGLGSKAGVTRLDLDAHGIGETWDGFLRLIASYEQQATGYTARARLEKRGDVSDYDHLSRLSEWNAGDPPMPEDVG
jgi:ATP-dependent helicase/nuclease subunit B